MMTYEYWGGGDEVRYKLADDPLRFFATGVGRRGHGTGTMTPLIQRQFRYLTRADVEALFAYLSAPASKTTAMLPSEAQPPRS